MCGRYTLTQELDQLVETFGVPAPAFAWAPRFNIAPTQVVPVIAEDRHGRRMGLMRWGLVPYWAEEPRIGNRHINARAETVSTRPAFKGPFERRRCLVPADGFYEWAVVDGGKRPHWIHAEDGGVMTFAGLWDRWRMPDGDSMYSFTILTVPASADVVAVHDRMPAILEGSDRDVWLRRDAGRERALGVLRPLGSGRLHVREVSTWVNTPANDDPTCIEPAD